MDSGTKFADGLAGARRYSAIAAVSLGTVLTTVDGTIVNVALPTLARDLQVSPSSAVLVVTVYQLVMMTALLPLSALSGRLGHRATYQYGQMVFIVATMLCFFARSLPFLVLVRGVQALGAAAAISVASALIRSIYPPTQLGRGLSFNTVIASASASFAPTLGGALLTFATWPWLFAVVVPFGIVSILLGRKSLPQGIRNNEPYNVLGAVMCAGMFVLVISGLESSVHGDSPVISAALVVVGVVLGFFFVRRERSQPQPVLPVDLLRLKSVALPSCGSLAAYIGTMIMMISLPFQLQQHYHFSPAAAGAALAPMPLISVIASPLAGLLSDRYPTGLLGLIGIVFGVAGLISLALLPADPQQIDVLWRVGLCGLGFGTYFSPTARQVIGSAPIERVAAAGALYSTTRGVGHTLGATAVAALLATGLGFGPVPMFVAAGLSLIAGICCLEDLRPQKRPLPNADLPEL
jgi:DHA2 family multidrug resistance protein-like MFS transporter